MTTERNLFPYVNQVYVVYFGMLNHRLINE